MQRRCAEYRTRQSQTQEASDGYGGADSDDEFPGHSSRPGPYREYDTRIQRVPAKRWNSERKAKIFA
jgi:hypothetical protein